MSIYFFIFIFVLFVCFCVLFLYKYFYNKKCVVTFLYSSVTIIFLFFVSDMTSSSGKRKSTRPSPLADEDLQNFLDMLDNDDDDDGALTGTDIEDGDSDDDDEGTETNFVNIVDNKVGTNINSSNINEDETTNDDKIIQTVDHNNPIIQNVLNYQI